MLLFTGVLFLRWTWLGCRNAWALQPDGLSVTPGWAVRWYFVPIVQLWKPYQALKEVFKASYPDYGADWREAPDPKVLSVWWDLWLASCFFGQAALQLDNRAETIQQVLWSSWLSFASTVLDVPLGVVVILMVSRLHDLQSAKYRAIAAREA